MPFTRHGPVWDDRWLIAEDPCGCRLVAEDGMNVRVWYYHWEPCRYEHASRVRGRSIRYTGQYRSDNTDPPRGAVRRLVSRYGAQPNLDRWDPEERNVYWAGPIAGWLPRPDGWTPN